MSKLYLNVIALGETLCFYDNASSEQKETRQVEEAARS